MIAIFLNYLVQSFLNYQYLIETWISDEVFTYCSFIHSGYFYSTSASPLMLRSASNTARILLWSFTPKRHRQLRVKDLSKVPTNVPSNFQSLCAHKISFVQHFTRTHLNLE